MIKEIKFYKKFLNNFLIVSKLIENINESSLFMFDYVYLLQYKCDKINFKCGEPYIDYRDWVKNEKGRNKFLQ